jgi:heme-degrading monooxygenase HmoA
MAAVIVQHHVEDYDRWLPAYKEHGEVRRANGGTGHQIFRTADDPNDLVIVNEFDSLEGAKAFMADPSLKEQMGRAGVNSEPKVWLCDDASTERY